jgi:DNA anti-recombination protein RmuC|tara:strand:+ start:5459 stop:5788 length:330 start_codon:yes stop_codon:yes gene_type:complete
MIKWIKEQWQWIVGGLLAIIAIAASKKRDSVDRVEKSDSKAKAERDQKVNESQKKAYEEFISKRSEAEEKFREEVEAIAENKVKRQKELENNPEELDKILKEKYKLKGE